MDTQHINRELLKWSEDVIKDVTPILKKYKLDFYPFQSKLNIKSNILIIGLNPASNGYDGTQELHEVEPQLNISSTKIFEGNKEYENDKYNWRIYQNLMKISFFKKFIG